MKNTSIWIASATAAATLIGGGVALEAATKSVELSLDGTTSQVNTFSGDVSELLDSRGVELTSHDSVVPSEGTKLVDRQTINVRYGKKLTVTIDGKKKTIWTTKDTVGGALAQLGIRNADTELSVDRSLELGRQPLSFTATTPKAVTVTIGGKAQKTETAAGTVGELLKELKVTKSSTDKLSPAASTPITKGMKVTLTRISSRTVTGKATVNHKTVRVETSKLAKGKTSVSVQGKDGTVRRTYKVTVTNGKETARKVVSTKAITAPVTQKVLVGTRVSANTSSSASTSGGNTGSTSGLNPSRAAMWDRIAQCESGGNWSINTGNGYYGGLQFNTGTWLSAGGGKYASRPDRASRAQQITIANNLYASRGLQPWGCAHAA